MIFVDVVLLLLLFLHSNKSLNKIKWNKFMIFSLGIFLLLPKYTFPIIIYLSTLSEKFSTTQTTHRTLWQDCEYYEIFVCKEENFLHHHSFVFSFWINFIHEQEHEKELLDVWNILLVTVLIRVLSCVYDDDNLGNWVYCWCCCFTCFLNSISLDYSVRHFITKYPDIALWIFHLITVEKILPKMKHKIYLAN